MISREARVGLVFFRTAKDGEATFKSVAFNLTRYDNSRHNKTS